MFGGGSAFLSIVKEKKKRKSDTDLPILDEGEVVVEDEKC
jgi:hypothetical protein